MFEIIYGERLERIKSMVLRSGVQVKYGDAYASVLNQWQVWALDGKAYLFKESHGLIADWFEFCDFYRQRAQKKLG